MSRKMGLRFEREFWQGTVSFSEGSAVAPHELVKLMSGLESLVPNEGMQWEIPALQPGAATQYQIGPMGVATLTPDVLSGTSPTGWVVQINAAQLLVRHQILVDEAGPFRRRAASNTSPPSPETFSEVLRRVIALVPETMLRSARRASLLANYAMATGETYPGSFLRWRRKEDAQLVSFPPAEGKVFRVLEHDLEFETFDGHQVAWNDTARVGNWFAADGVLMHNSAVVRGVEVRTAAPEPGPVPIPMAGPSLPQLSAAHLQRFFALDEGLGLRRVLDRFRRWMPEGVDFDE